MALVLGGHLGPTLWFLGEGCVCAESECPPWLFSVYGATEAFPVPGTSPLGS